MAMYRATVTEIEELAPAVFQLTAAIDESGFVFQPGQWVNFRFPEGVSRAYTIASAPQQPDAVQLCVRIGPGRGGTALKTLSPGDAVTLEGPHGDFLVPDNDAPVVLMAGDVGIAPVRSIVLHMLAQKDPRRIAVLYEPDHRYILYAGDFDPLARSGSITHESGKIEALIARNLRSINRSTLMAAGFDSFLDRVRYSLRENEIEGELITESFGQAP